VSGSGVVGEWGLDEGGGTVAVDSSGNGMNGALLNGVTYTTGRSGMATLHTGGVNQHIRVPNAPVLASLTGKLTLSAWVRPTDLTAESFQGVITRQFGTSWNDQWYLSIFNGYPTMGVNTPVGGNQSVRASAKVAVGQWTHLAGTYDGAMVRLYVNGVQVASFAKSGDLVAASTPVIIGGNQNDAVPDAAEELFRGAIDNPVVYNVALTPTEIATLAVR